jgi:hypothetical protein
MFDAQDTSQENESEILLKKMKKIAIFRCRKNYRLDLLRCMREILKLKKNEFPPFWTKKYVSLFASKKASLFVQIFDTKNDIFFSTSFKFQVGLGARTLAAAYIFYLISPTITTSCNVCLTFPSPKPHHYFRIHESLQQLSY